VRFKDKQYQDEFTFFQMCLAIEQSFNIEFTDTEVLELDTVEELAKLVQTKREPPCSAHPTYSSSLKNIYELHIVHK
jgi:hypothetical protein